ncbi:MAG: hypothetical protein VB106_19280 [Clostridiaceae bacterium]|jgi:hypothetical protein|nr:hypothetical protein [Clostridiaceae bacterium]
MKWNEVRKIYPNQFVKFEILKSHVESDKEYVDEIAVIGPVSDDEATLELLGSKGNVLVYHTANEALVVKLRTRIGLRRVLKDAH